CICHIHSVTSHFVIVKLNPKFGKSDVSINVQIFNSLHIFNCFCYLICIFFKLKQIISKDFYHKRTLNSCYIFLYIILNRLTKDRKSTRLNSSHVKISYAVFCLKKKKKDSLKMNQDD